jgi:hypothetical protein
MNRNALPSGIKPSTGRRRLFTIAGLLSVAAIAGSLADPATAGAQVAPHAVYAQQSDNVTTFHMVKVDGVNIFYGRQGRRTHLPCCSCMASPLRRICSATLFRNWPIATT